MSRTILTAALALAATPVVAADGEFDPSFYTDGREVIAEPETQFALGTSLYTRDGLTAVAGSVDFATSAVYGVDGSTVIELPVGIPPVEAFSVPLIAGIVTQSLATAGTLFVPTGIGVTGIGATAGAATDPKSRVASGNARSNLVEAVLARASSVSAGTWPRTSDAKGAAQSAIAFACLTTNCAPVWYGASTLPSATAVGDSVADGTALYVGGFLQATPEEAPRATLQRFLPIATEDGDAPAPDPAFAGDGALEVAFATPSLVTDLTRRGEDIYVAGDAAVGLASGRWQVARYDAVSGELDESYGVDGLASFELPGYAPAPFLGEAGIFGLGPQPRASFAPDGSAVLVGRFVDGEVSRHVVARFDANGAPDLTFGDGDGYVELETLAPTLGLRPADVAVDERGRIYLAGPLDDVLQATSGFVVRLTPAGALDCPYGDADDCMQRVAWLDGLAQGIFAIALDGGRPVVTGLLASDGDEDAPPIGIPVARLTTDALFQDSFEAPPPGPQRTRVTRADRL